MGREVLFVLWVYEKIYNLTGAIEKYKTGWIVKSFYKTKVLTIIRFLLMSLSP